MKPSRKADSNNPIRLVAEMLNGSVRALGRLISLVEDEEESAQDVLKRVHYYSKDAYIIGVTGAPGTGKSTLIDQLAHQLKNEGMKLGIIAIDPSSPFTGGAFLGDRVRMRKTSCNNDIYIRSMGTRGNLGGLSAATVRTVKILDAFGKDIILIETVGTGQAEVDIVKEADSTIVVCVPGLGDEIQAMKAGVMEIGDIIVVNKADQGDADKLVGELQAMLQMGLEPGGWMPPIVKTVATNGVGVAVLAEEICNHREFLVKNSGLKKNRKSRIQFEIFEILKNRINQRLKSVKQNNELDDEILTKVMHRQTDPYTVADQLVEEIFESFGDPTTGSSGLKIRKIS